MRHRLTELVSGADRLRGAHLLHQVVVPFAVDLEVGGAPEFDGLDQIVRDVGVDAGLPEGIESSSSRTAI